MPRTTLIGLLLFLLSGTVAAAPAAAEARTITDMAGRTVRLPPAGQIQRIATPDGTPAVNAFVSLFGQGGRIVNGLPMFIRNQGARWRLQTVVAPQLAHQPAVSEPPGWNANLETLLSLHPDVVFAVEVGNIRSLESKGFATVAVTWRNPDSIRRTVDLMGEVFENPARAKEYIAYLDEVQAKIGKRLQGLPESARRKAVYLRQDNLTSPMRPTAGWLIEHAGGIPVPAIRGVLAQDTLQLSPEQLLADNPDVIVMWSRGEVELAYGDPRLRQLGAVRQHRLIALPRGFMPWTHYTPELAPALLWMAKTLYPERFTDIDLATETAQFYRRFFGLNLADGEVRELLSGTP